MGLALARMILRVIDGEMSDASAADWSDLPPELIYNVSANLQTLADYIRFRAVCRSWRAAAPVNPRHLPREFPWLMFSLSGASNRRGFFNPLTKELHRTTLLEDSLGCRRVGSSFGWLILIDESPSIFLLDPLSRRRIDLPPLMSFSEWTDPKEIPDDLFKKVILSHSPHSKPDFTAFAIINHPFGLAYCKHGDGSWKVLDAVRSPGEDVIYFRGSFYAVNQFGSMAICNLKDERSPKVRFINVRSFFHGHVPYLAGLTASGLLLVLRYLEYDIDFEQFVKVCKTVRFHVFRFDWKAKMWASLESLGDEVLFLGMNSCLAMKASDYPGCKGNRIYFTDDYSVDEYRNLGGDHDVGVYNLADETVELFPSCPRNSHEPIWIAPNLR